jgi:hypothetical protein
MTKTFLLIAFMVTGACVKAQTTERIIVKAGDDLGQAISQTGHYRFARFTDGVVTMKYGSKSKTRFNYHICNGEMQFIDTKGDTLAISQTEYIDNINIGENTKFVFADKFFHEIVGESPEAKLGKRIRVNIENDRKTGFGKSDPTASQMQLNNVLLNQRTLALSLSYDIEVRKTTSYYWIDKEYNAIPTTKKNSLKLVEKDKQPTLQAFMDENKTNFDNEEDLRKLLAFAATL